MDEAEICGDLSRDNMNLETAQIAWKELQRFFAAGKVIVVGTELDLIEVAYQFSINNTHLVEQWLAEKTIGKASDQQATEWFEKDILLWATVVKPWVLVQLSTTNVRFRTEQAQQQSNR